MAKRKDMTDEIIPQEQIATHRAYFLPLYQMSGVGWDTVGLCSSKELAEDALAKSDSYSDNQRIYKIMLPIKTTPTEQESE